jgi:crotonobetaine/carnitine-CoA ligase
MRWAGAFHRAGVTRGDTVVTMLPNSFEAYYAWLGVGWLEAIEVPANNMYRGHMLQYLLEDSEAELLVISQRYVDRLESVAGALSHLKTVVVFDTDGAPPPNLPFHVITGDEFLDGAALVDEPRGPSYYDVGAMIYTSGTTGPSKGVLVPWGELIQAALILPDSFVAEGEAYYSIYPVFHLSGKCGLYISTHHEAHLVIREQLSITQYWDDIRRFDVRSAGLVGPIASMLLAMPPADDDADNPLDKIAMGPVIPEIDEFMRRFGIGNITTGYGMTEIGFPIGAPWNPPNPNTCGRRREGAPHYEVKVVDEHDEEVPVGTVGELIVRSRDPWVMNSGYWKLPAKTAESWRNGWFHTGDGFMEDDEGWLYFVDRLSDTLRHRGENVSSFEVEAGILEHPAVGEVAVVGVPSELGEDDVKAFIVCKADTTLEPHELIDFLAPRMPKFMIPRYIELIDSLPRTDATFRVRKVELRTQAAGDATWDRVAAGHAIPDV